MKPMKTWQIVRIILRMVTVAAGTAATSLSHTAPLAAAIIGAVAAITGTLSIDLPRDRWTEEEKKAYRKRTASRSNPLLSALLWRTGPPPEKPSA